MIVAEVVNPDVRRRSEAGIWTRLVSDLSGRVGEGGFRRLSHAVILAATILLEIAPAAAQAVTAAATQTTDGVYEAVSETLVLLFGLAVIMESALAGLFRWRPFVEMLNPRAVRPLVSFILSAIIVFAFDLDLVTSLVNGSTDQTTRPVLFIGQVLTALVVAGGSAGINSIFVSIGIRQVSTPATIQPKLESTEAWIAVKVDRGAAVGPINVFIGPQGAPKLVAVLPSDSPSGGTGAAPWYSRFFLADRGRFPRYGGYTLTANQPFVVTVEGNGPPGANGVPGAALSASWGPYAAAPKAIVDIELKL